MTVKTLIKTLQGLPEDEKKLEVYYRRDRVTEYPIIYVSVRQDIDMLAKSNPEKKIILW